MSNEYSAAIVAGLSRDEFTELKIGDSVLDDLEAFRTNIDGQESYIYGFAIEKTNKNTVLCISENQETAENYINRNIYFTKITGQKAKLYLVTVID